MSSSKFIEGFAGVELELPDGTIIKAQAPTLADAARCMKLFGDVASGEADAVLELMELFPRAISAPDLLEARLLPTEFIQVVDRFFAQAPREPNGNPADPAEPSPSPMTIS